MVNLGSQSPRTAWALSQIKTSHGVLQKDSFPLQATQPPPIQSPSSSSRISPAVLFIIVILAVIFFVSGLLHLLVRFLIRKNPSSSSSSHSNHHNQEISNSDALQRQLQQLFHLHDSGLDQAFIDALPVFLYREIVGSKEPFDCAVCLCEFSQDDKLRLLPICGHAFHLNCIDTWLLSNSTCPLCRGALFLQGVAIENPIFDFEEELRLEEGRAGDHGEVEEIGREKRVVPVRLGKFRNTSNRDDAVGAVDTSVNGNSIIRREEGESSSSNLDARRCYSMGSYQYVVGDANLRVALTVGDGKGGKVRGLASNPAVLLGNEEGKRLGAGSKGESFSVSKIWLWGNKGKFPVASDASSLDGGLPWTMPKRSEGNT